MPKRYELSGKKFNLLKVISYAGPSNCGKSMWNCECDCGGKKTTLGQSIVEGRVTCCGQEGCIGLKTGKDAHVYRHGLIHTLEYKTWGSMVYRCTNPNSPAWKHYGGRGIKCCDEWRDFINFYNDLGPKPSPEYELDRIDNNGNYCKENCRWTTRKENVRNVRSNILVEYNGKMQKLIVLSDDSNVPINIIRYRIKTGWLIEDALKYPKGTLKKDVYHV